MIAQCIKCGNHEWNKKAEGNKITCPACGYSWIFKKLPLFILTGCSGIGKTTTAHELMLSTTDVVVLDADFFYNLMPHETPEDYFEQIEKLEDLSKNIMQAGKPVLWAMAGNLDKLNGVYNRQFFSDIFCLALVCNEETLRHRMMRGRGISDEEWIQSSVEYNNYFKTHTAINDIPFDVCDTEGKNLNEVVEEVKEWIAEKMRGVSNAI